MPVVPRKLGSVCDACSCSSGVQDESHANLFNLIMNCRLQVDIMQVDRQNIAFKLSRILCYVGGGRMKKK